MLSLPLFHSYYSNVVPFSLSFDKETDLKYMVYPKELNHVKVCTDCKGMDILPKVIVNSQDKKSVGYGNHYNMLFLTLHATTESLVHDLYGRFISIFF